LIADPKFKTIDDARKALDHIRTLKPPSEKLMNKGHILGPAGEDKPGAVVKEAYMNPFQTAFVVPNPTLPPPKPATPTDTMATLRHLNSAEEYSLFKCPGKWTLVVKSYQGASTIVSKDS